MHANVCSVKDYMNSINVSFTGSHKIFDTVDNQWKGLKMYFKLCYVYTRSNRKIESIKYLEKYILDRKVKKYVFNAF